MLEQFTVASTPLQLARPPLPSSLALAARRTRDTPAPRRDHAAPGTTPCRPLPSPRLIAAFSPAKSALSRGLQRRHRLSYKLAAVNVDAELPQPTPVILTARPYATPPLSAAPIKG
jgi:hypothetical protein